MKRLTFVIALFLAVGYGQSYAQFEGKIMFDVYLAYTGFINKEMVSLYITEERILLEAETESAESGPKKVIFRLNNEDIIIFTDKNKALKITKSDVSAFTAITTNFQKLIGTVAPNWMKISFQKTDEEKTINGYSAQKFLLTSALEPNNKAVLWMTKELDINWGILGGLFTKMFDSYLDPSVSIIEEGYFPLLIQSFKDGELQRKIEAVVLAGNVPESKMTITSNVQIIDLQDYFSQMMEGFGAMIKAVSSPDSSSLRKNKE